MKISSTEKEKRQTMDVKGQEFKPEEYYKKALLREALSYVDQGTVSLSNGNFRKAKDCFEKALAIRKEVGDRRGEAADCGSLGIVLQALGENGKAEEYHGKSLKISKEIDDRKGQASSYENLGTVFHSYGQYGKAKEYHEQALAIKKEIGDHKGEARGYGNLGEVFLSSREIEKAKEYEKKALGLQKEIGDRKGEATSYASLGVLYQSVGEYCMAKDNLKKALSIREEIGDRYGEATDYENLGGVFYFLREYGEARKYHEKALEIRKEIGDRKGEASSHENIGTVFQSLAEYGKAKDHLEKALAITKEIGDRKGEASSCGKLGAVFQSLGEYFKAKECLQNALALRKEMGDKKGEAADYGNLGNSFHSLGEYDKAKEYHEEALRIRREINDMKGQAASHANIGNVFRSLGEYEEAVKYYEEALTISITISDTEGKGSSYGNLGAVLFSLGKNSEAEKHLEKALAIRKTIGDRKGEATDYSNLGILSRALKKHDKAKQYHQEALRIRNEIGDREGEIADYGNLGTLFLSRGEYGKAKEYHHKAIQISKEIGNAEAELRWHQIFTQDLILEGNMQDAFSNLFACIHKFEHLRGLLKENDKFKICLLDEHVLSYRMLSELFCTAGSHSEALYVVELGRARALADLMSARYDVEKQITVNPNSWASIERIISNERNCTCLYFFYIDPFIFLWVLGADKSVRFCRIGLKDIVRDERRKPNLEKFLGKNITFRKFRVLPRGPCEDRSLFSPNDSPPTGQSSLEDNLADFRLLEEVDEDDQELEPSLSLYYKLIIAPVVHLLEEPEIVFIPDRSLYNIPFAALLNEEGKCLSESFRIRIVPSLTFLKLVQDCPAEYHSQTGALIVGDPEVGHVIYKGELGRKCSLPGARKEAEMIGQLLDTQPLLGKQATKQAVLQRIHSVSLIHFAAHGNAERGEIALAPLQPSDRYAAEEEYLLTMTDISKVPLRAKLVVLSCCHSGKGKVRAEGIVGIARAFLGSGARSVLVSLWAVSDEATEQLMRRFYEHLVQGESTSESLHQAMEWMRRHDFPDVRDWAPFMLIGDDVKFDIEELKVSSLR